MRAGWTVERYTRGVDALHALGIPERPVRTLRWCIPERSALVLGSAQPESDVDNTAARSAGIDIVRRRSGGGAVLVEPQNILWCDVVLPADDVLWQHDIGRAFLWLGHAFAGALYALGHDEVRVHEGALVTTKWSRKACFAGIGPGECTVGGKKAVGISQRRTKTGALFQCALLTSFDPGATAALLALEAGDREELAEFLATSVTTVPRLDESALEAALLHSLPNG